jgi:hypothetical protein
MLRRLIPSSSRRFCLTDKCSKGRFTGNRICLSSGLKSDSALEHPTQIETSGRRQSDHMSSAEFPTDNRISSVIPALWNLSDPLQMKTTIKTPDICDTVRDPSGTWNVFPTPWKQSGIWTRHICRIVISNHMRSVVISLLVERKHSSSCLTLDFHIII